MPHKYAIIFPPCHGGNFLGELLTLGQDLYSFHGPISQSATIDRLATYISRYTHTGDWVENEKKFRINYASEPDKIEIIAIHIYAKKISNEFKIITADAFGSNAGILWANASRYYLFQERDGYRKGMHHDEDQHYTALKNSKLPFLRVDMTEFLNPVFPTMYYKELCYHLGINPTVESASQLHAVWVEKRVTPHHYQCHSTISDTMRSEWSKERQKVLLDRHILAYNTAVENKVKILKETYHNVKGPDWPEYSTSDNFFDQLPLWVKKECEEFGIDWKKLSIPEIHDYTQLAIKHGYPVDPYYQYTHIVPNLLLINQHTL
jgi:hypothetical protein